MLHTYTHTKNWKVIEEYFYNHVVGKARETNPEVREEKTDSFN